MIAREQLLDLGLTRRVIDGLVTDGWLHRVHTGVYVVGHPRLDRHANWLAATLAVDGVLSHRSAAELWGLLPPRGGLVHATAMTSVGRRRRGIVVHRRPLAAHQRTWRDGVPCTTLVRTLCDLAGQVDRPTLARAFEQAQVLHGLAPVVLASAVLSSPGQRGNDRLRALLTGAVDPGAVESVFELRFLGFCRTYALGRPRTQERFGRWRADFFFAEHGTVVETDGGRFHATAAARARDARKTADLEARGLLVLRVSWAELHYHPDELAARIRAAFSASAPSSPASGENGRLAP
ncbi:MAG: DUF559 domain-containing protein [Solirubrobacteraceae bacterium]